MVGGPGDKLGTPPSARGFSLMIFERGLNKYTKVFKATEENGYAFIIYSDGEKKLILKGGKGSDHKETVFNGSKELQDIRKQKYSDQDDITFLRKICLSGRAWVVDLQNKKYYFIGIWNTTITPEQNEALKEYLSKFPKDSTYIQMGQQGSDASSKFGLVNSFSPKIAKSQIKLTDKEKDFIQQAHMRTSELPAAYAKQLQKLKGLSESQVSTIKTTISLMNEWNGLSELDYSGAVGVHELMMFYPKATDDQRNQMDSCLDNKDFECVRSLITQVTGMSTDHLKEFELEEGWKDWLAAGAIGLGALHGGNLKATTPSATYSNSAIDQSFVDYIKSVENAARVGFDKQKKLWFPHKSVEGGSDTIGYGHKIQSGEDFSNGITDSQADSLLKKDLEKAKKQVEKEVGTNRLSKKQMEMFVDFVFNMGTLKKFPKFTAAALSNDVSGMRAQYKRFTGGRELKGRNAAFLQRFLTEYFGFNYSIG